MEYDFINKDANATQAEIMPATQAEPFDIDHAKQAFEIFESKINRWAEAVKDADLKTEIDAGLFTDTISKGKTLIKDLEKLRKNITANAYQFYKDVLGFERYYSNMIEAKVINPADQKLSFYFKQIEIKNQKAEKAARAAAAKKQKIGRAHV